MNIRRTLPALLLGTVLTAQIELTFPSDHAAIPDGFSSQTWFPYSYGVSRMQAVYESWDLNIPAGRQITRIGFRADGNTMAIGHDLNLHVVMGHTNETAASLTNNYDNNFLAPATTVFGPGLFQMPDLNNPLNPNPDGSIIWLDLATPFTFDPTKNLLVEWRVLANSNGSTQFSYPLDRCRFVSPVTTGPAGCPHSGGQAPQLTSTASKIGSNWVNQLTQAPASQPVIFLVNAGSPLTTPYPLAPILPGVAATCTGQLSPVGLFAFNETTNNFGSATLSIAIPYNLAFNDAILSSQAVCFDFFAPGGLAVSNGDQIELGVDPAMSIVWRQGSTSAPTGTIYRNWGVVTLFEHN